VLDVKKNKLIWAQVLFMAGLAPFFIFPSLDRTWILLVVGGWFVFKWKVSGRFLKRTVVDWAMFVLLLQIFISTLGAEDCVLSVPKVTGVLYGILVFYALVEFLNSKKRIKMGLVVFLVGGILLSLVGILGMESLEKKTNSAKLDFVLSLNEKIPKINFSLPRAEEGISPNAVGGTLVLVIPLFFALMIYYRRHKREEKSWALFFWSSLVFFLLEIFILFLTASRGSWMALTVALAFMVWIYFLIPKKKAVWIGPLLGGVAVLLVLGYMALIRTENIGAAADELEGKYKGRQQAWSVGMRVAKENPLTGLGMNNVRMEEGIGYDRAHVHNQMLNIAAELGIPGLMAFLAVLSGVGFMVWRVWWQSRDSWMRAVVLGLAGGQLAHFIWGMGDTITLGGKPGIVFWVSVGLIAGVYDLSFRA